MGLLGPLRVTDGRGFVQPLRSGFCPMQAGSLSVATLVEAAKAATAGDVRFEEVVPELSMTGMGAKPNVRFRGVS